MASTQLDRPVWQVRRPEETNTAKFMSFVNKRHNLSLQSYDDLHQWSVGDTSFDAFWHDAYEWLGLAPAGTTKIGKMLQGENAAATPLFPPPTFFPDDRLNLAEFLLRRGPDAQVAIHFAREGVADTEHVTWRQLRERVRCVRDALASSGIWAGDVVAAVISNSIDAIVLCLASLSLGAVWSSSSPDLGPDAIVDRYGQVDPSIIFADDGYVYAGKQVTLTERIAQWSHAVGRVSAKLADVVVIPYCGAAVDTSAIYRGRTWDAFLGRGTGRDLDFALMPFSHPAFILFSSGTTGKPKCMIHSSGGVALKVQTDMVLQHDIRPTDVVFQYTTTSWVMWVLNFANLSTGKSMLLYDGSPFHPRPTILLELAQDVGVTVFGTSPRYLGDLKKRGIVPREQFDLSKLRMMTSTGSVLSAEQYDWFYDVAFPPDAQLISMSGGTDIAGCFVAGTPLLPVYRGEIQAKALGMAVDIFDSAQTEHVSVEATGNPGELVCTKPFPSQPVTFHGAGGQDLYKSSYFERFGVGVWCQGDFVQRIKATGGLLMLGRSDGVLNPSGVRFGSAEIYAVTEKMAEIADSICVGQRRDCDADERVLLFVKMQPGKTLTQALEQDLKTAIRQTYSARHVPRFIFEVADIPYTVNGKKCEINVKHIVNCRKAAVSGTVANPAALKLFEQFQQLPGDEAVVKSKL
ncbi:acetoacetyl-synthase [Grosmannia clavigera kw1407]|uniref:Acetoacetyl-synthase n=1 Tax=Grosmannia clavigera (strain kw1407 / UAMH 11150) TaxID=655863 RepID=F0X798_GROCL|nr:acetoacetyl-synthase [Grosmannia clavigera kw1407]EFX06638.1 acetoacetyl-synthase [Grosmannia clavigera kw1407]